MKKIALLLVTVFALALGLSSCASGHKCAAYGNTYQSSGYNKR